MILVYGWVDGFGNNTVLVGVYDSIKTAREHNEPEWNEHELRYEEIDMNEKAYLDYYEAEPLFPKKLKEFEKGNK